MTPFQTALHAIAWTPARLAANCVMPLDEIEMIVRDERPAYDDSLPIRVLEQRGVEFIVEVGGRIVGAKSPMVAPALQQIDLTDEDWKLLRDLKRGPRTIPFVDFAGRHNLHDKVRRNGLVDLGTVQEILHFNGEAQTRSGSSIAVRLSERGWALLALKDQQESAEQLRDGVADYSALEQRV